MIEIIPAIDIIEGKCVRLSQGDYERKKIYNEDPLEVAKTFEDHGITRLHVVDLDGAKAQHIVNYKTLERIATGTGLTIDFGGGLKSDDDLRIAFENGATMITGGSIAVKHPEIFLAWLKKYGSKRIILGADAKGEKISVNGWQEETEEALIPFIRRFEAEGINKVICTDISKDGMLAGPSVELYEKIKENIPNLYLIASGGVSGIHDIEKLHEANIPAVIFGKAIYEGKITLKELTKFIINA